MLLHDLGLNAQRIQPDFLRTHPSQVYPCDTKCRDSRYNYMLGDVHAPRMQPPAGLRGRIRGAEGVLLTWPPTGVRISLNLGERSRAWM